MLTIAAKMQWMNLSFRIVKVLAMRAGYPSVLNLLWRVARTNKILQRQ